MYVPLIELAGAVALLLWGLRMVRTGMSRVFGSGLQRVLATGTRNRFVAFACGLAITLGMQSSTATALMVAGFAGQGLITTAMALAVMLGADIATSIAAQLFASGITGISPALILIGLIVFRVSGANRLRAFGRLVLGVGLVLLALQLLVATTAPMRVSPVVLDLLSALSAMPVLAAIVSMLLSLLAASSLAVVLLVMSLAAAGVLDPALTVALVLGANLGSGILPVLATWADGNVARRAPAGNLILRAAGVVVALPLAAPFGDHLVALTGSPERLAVDAHLAFNCCLVLAGLPLLGPLARALEHFFPQTVQDTAETGPRYLDTAALGSPALALAAAARETMRIGDVVEDMLDNAAKAIDGNETKRCADIAGMDDTVDSLHEAVKLYLARLSRQDALDEDEAQRATEIITFAINLEHAGDIIDRNLRELIAKKIKNRLSFSTEGEREITERFGTTLENLQLAQTVFLERDRKLAKRLLKAKAQVRAAEQASTDNHLERLKAGTPETLLTSSIHLDIMRDLRRINAHFVSAAYPVLEH